MPWIFSKVAEEFDKLLEKLFFVLVQFFLLLARVERSFHNASISGNPCMRILKAIWFLSSFGEGRQINRCGCQPFFQIGHGFVQHLQGACGNGMRRYQYARFQIKAAIR